MALVLSFGVVLYVAVLLSQRARTSVLSTAVLFLLAGVVLGQLPIAIPTADTLLQHVARIALFVILFVDGAQLRISELREAWKLPGRALLVGLPLTVAVTAVAAVLLLGFDWFAASLVAFALAPTDPVMVRTLLARKSVPERLRRLLSVESGLNDGVALPPLMILLSLHGLSSTSPLGAIIEAAGGIAIGVAAGLLAYTERIRWLGVSSRYRPLLGVAIGAVSYAVCDLAHANELLAAFAAGVTFASVQGELANAMVDVGEPISEVLKLATLLVFGVTLRFDLDPMHLAFAAATLLAARPIALLLALLGGGLGRKEWLTAAWFGPKGFASLLYAALLVSSGADTSFAMYHVIGIVVAVSIIAHSSTDWLVARTFDRGHAASA